MWRWVAGVQAGVIATFLFAWLTMAREAVTKEELREALKTTPEATAIFRTTTQARISDMEAHLGELRSALADHDKDHKTIEACSKRIEIEISEIQKAIEALKQYHNGRLK